jgi:hypothetical protein
MALEIKGDLAEELNAFKRGRATTDLFFLIWQLIEKNWECGKYLVMIFIDYKKTFYSARMVQVLVRVTSVAQKQYTT